VTKKNDAARLRLLAWNAFFNLSILFTNIIIVSGVIRHWND
jgi:hypothetical protein